MRVLGGRKRSDVLLRARLPHLRGHAPFDGGYRIGDEGDHLLKLEYLDTSDVVLARSDQLVLRVN